MGHDNDGNDGNAGNAGNAGKAGKKRDAPTPTPAEEAERRAAEAERRRKTRHDQKAKGRDRPGLEAAVKKLEEQVKQFKEANPDVARLAEEVAQKEAALKDVREALARGAVRTPAMLQLTKITALAKLRGTFDVVNYTLPDDPPNGGGADNLGLPTEQADAEEDKMVAQLLQEMESDGCDDDDYDPNDWEPPIHAGEPPSSAGQTPSRSAEGHEVQQVQEVREVREVQTTRKACAGVEVRKGLRFRRPKPKMMSFKFEAPLSTTVNVFPTGTLFVLNSPNELKAIKALEEVTRWLGREADMAHIVASFKVNSYEGQYRSNKGLSVQELERLETVVPRHIASNARYEPELGAHPALILNLYHNGGPHLMTAKITSGNHGAVIQMMGRKGSKWGLLMETFEEIYKLVDWSANPVS